MRTLAALTLLAQLYGCGESCNLIYAPDGVLVVFDGALADGLWEIALGDAACELEVPTGVLACDPNLSVTIDEAGQPLEAFRQEWAPTRFDLRLHHEGELVYEQEVRPVYEVNEPNGPGCGERRVGFVQVRL